jgi:hypothetical protein
VASGDTVVAVLLCVFVVAFAAYLRRALARSSNASSQDRSPSAPELRPIDQRLPLNTVTVADHVYLRVITDYEPSVHLVCKLTEWGGRGPRSAVQMRHAEQGLKHLASYDDDDLLFPMWTKRTLCGLRWKSMADHDDEVSAITSTLSTTATPSTLASHPTPTYVCGVCAVHAADASRNELV